MARTSSTFFPEGAGVVSFRHAGMNASRRKRGWSAMRRGSVRSRPPAMGAPGSAPSWRKRSPDSTRRRPIRLCNQSLARLPFSWPS